MAISGYIGRMRELVGHRLLLVPSAAACVFDAEGRLLLVRQHGSADWALPGGAVEVDETPEQGAERETFEEVGLRVRAYALLGAYGGPGHRVTYPNGDEAAYVCTVYACEVLEGSPVPDDDEIAELRFVSEAEAKELTLRPWLVDPLPGMYAWWRARPR
ncbi:NUDIX domain-containing protein [Allonocardiopsis opalescens]|uniref:ADP-ribose pyrophosphatase YjhB (NUDIX family) n=1 Tax=Allonocardiopsis opalescens TaxID=1144618 RepID=A0A2T0QFD6_9ACTN|nr:NUDIX domain-containing protein [Allonocardiopsis opalescens]PRY02644.1 ADP-ribose pyrophosphatase YjhB (NUDIX family) [Allonocardiopsis opalescens]